MPDENIDNSGALPLEVPRETNQQDNLPAKVQLFAADRITDVLPPAAYERIGTVMLTPEQEAMLDEPTADDEVDIRPDGLIYVSHDFIRRKLNKTFGRMQWTLLPGSPLAKRPGSNEYYQRWVLFIGGAYAAEALASREYFETNSAMSIDDVAEAIKSDCLRRCAKDLGVGIEAWNRRFQERWKREYAVAVKCQTRRGIEEQWRRKDGDKLRGELSGAQKPLDVPQEQNPQPRTTQSSAGQVKVVQDAEGKPKPSPAVREKPASTPPAAASQSPRTNGPASAGGPRGQETPTGTPRPESDPRSRMQSGMKILPAQARMIFARLRNAQLLVGDDGVPAMEFLHREMDIEIIQDDGKKSSENLAAMINEIPASRVTECARKLDAIAKEA